jgi:hypothetical protein
MWVERMLCDLDSVLNPVSKGRQSYQLVHPFALLLTDAISVKLYPS